jgi:hypothetical protein
MDMVMEKQAERAPLSVRLTDEEWELLENLQTVLGYSSRSQVVKQLIKAAHVRPASIKFSRPEEDRVTA